MKRNIAGLKEVKEWISMTESRNSEI